MPNTILTDEEELLMRMHEDLLSSDPDEAAFARLSKAIFPSVMKAVAAEADRGTDPEVLIKAMIRMHGWLLHAGVSEMTDESPEVYDIALDLFTQHWRSVTAHWLEQNAQETQPGAVKH